jgi:uncharacterized membrane protein YeaQ/YmgE (transglycosylase-associated protein family)
MVLWHWLTFIAFGLIVGLVARFVHPGPDPGGIVSTAVVGMAGSALGAWIGRLVGVYDRDRLAGGFFLSLVGAVVLLAIWRMLARRPKYA